MSQSLSGKTWREERIENFDVECKKIPLPHWHNSPPPSMPWPPHYRSFTITLRHTTLGRTPLDEWSARSGDLYLTTYNTHNRHTSISPAGYEHTISAGERRKTYTLDRAAAGIGRLEENIKINFEEEGKNSFNCLRTLSNGWFLPLL